MKSSVDRLDGLARRITVEIPPEHVAMAYSKIFKEIQRDAKIKGFRKGRAPLATIKKLYSDHAKSEVLNNLVEDSLQDAFREHSLRPITQPQLNFEGQLQEDQGFRFSAEFEIRPDVELKKIDGLKLKKEILVVGDDAVEKALAGARMQKAEDVPVLEDRPTAMGDIVEIDFEGFLNGQPLEGGSGQDHRLELGSHSFIDGFEEGLLGMKPGDQRELQLRFPDPYQEPSLAGQPVVFQVKVKKMLRRVLPEMNDAWAQEMGYTSLENMRATVRQNIENSEKRRIEEDLQKQALRVAVEANPMEAPAGLVKEQKKQILSDLAQRMRDSGLSASDFAEYVKKWAKDLDDTALFIVKSGFLIEALARHLKVKMDPSEIQAYLGEQATRSGLSTAEIAGYFSEGNRMLDLAFRLREKLVVDYLIKNATIEEVSAEEAAQLNG